MKVVLQITLMQTHPRRIPLVLQSTRWSMFSCGKQTYQPCKRRTSTTGSRCAMRLGAGSIG